MTVHDRLRLMTGGYFAFPRFSRALPYLFQHRWQNCAYISAITHVILRGLPTSNLFPLQPSLCNLLLQSAGIWAIAPPFLVGDLELEEGVKESGQMYAFSSIFLG